MSFPFQRAVALPCLNNSLYSNIHIEDKIGERSCRHFAKANWHLISDFSDQPSGFSLPRRVAITFWHVVDPLDSELPGRSSWVRDHTGLRRLAVSERARRDHLARHQDRVVNVQNACVAANHRCIKLSTVDGEVAALRRALAAGLGQ